MPNHPMPPPARTWSELLGRHPVIRRARGLGLAGVERENLLRQLDRCGAMTAQEAESLRAGPCSMAKLMGITAKVAELLEEIARIESGFGPARRETILSAVFINLEAVVGLPQEFIRGLFAELRWTSPDLQTVIAGGGLSAPVRRTRVEEVQAPGGERLLALVAKRLAHDLLIHGHSLRFFYQALPLLRDTLDDGCPGLTRLYTNFAATLQLLMMLYEGPFPDGAAIRAGRVEVQIREQAFRIRVSGLNFPSIFNEIVKGVYEALLHPGLPTAAALGADEAAFREMTAGPDLEYELQKIAPEVSVRVHRALLAIAEQHTARIQPILRRSGYGDLPPQGVASLLYRAYARLDPEETMFFTCRALAGPLSGITEKRLVRRILDNLEE